MLKTIVIISLFVFLSAAAAEEIGAISFGTNNYIGGSAGYEQISPNGAAFGLLVPVRFPNVVTHLKIKLAFHDVESDDPNLQNANFLHAINEVLLGYKFPTKNNITLLPQIGLGICAERFKMEEGVGDANIDLVLDASFRVDYQLNAFNLGALLNFERDMNLGQTSLMSPNRLNLALILSK